MRTTEFKLILKRKEIDGVFVSRVEKLFRSREMAEAIAEVYRDEWDAEVVEVESAA